MEKDTKKKDIFSEVSKTIPIQEKDFELPPVAIETIEYRKFYIKTNTKIDRITLMIMKRVGKALAELAKKKLEEKTRKIKYSKDLNSKWTLTKRSPFSHRLDKIRKEVSLKYNKNLIAFQKSQAIKVTPKMQRKFALIKVFPKVDSIIKIPKITITASLQEIQNAFRVID